MKKTIAILLVAILTVGMAFADATLTGKWTTGVAYDLEDNWVGFDNAIDNKVEIDFGWEGGSENEGDIYAVIKGKLVLDLDSTEAKPYLSSDTSFKITEASINGDGWKLNILKATSMPTFATGWETYDDGDENVDIAGVDFSGSTVKDRDNKHDGGVTLTVDGLFSAGVAANVDFDDNAPKSALAWVASDDLDFNGVIVAGAAGFMRANGANMLGIGAKGGFENDTISATVGADVAILLEKDTDFALDVAANIAYSDLLTADIYYATDTTLGYTDEEVFAIDTYGMEGADIFGSEGPTASALNRAFIGGPTENYLSLKAGFDLNSFDVPVTITLVGMDLINNPYVDAEAAFAIDAFDVTAFGGYQAILTDKYNAEGKKSGKELAVSILHAGATVGYTIDQVGKLSAGVAYGCLVPNVDNAELFHALSADVSITNTTLVSGATLKAGYKTPNIIGGDNAFMAQDAGELYLNCTLSF